MWNSDLHNAIIIGISLLKQQPSMIHRLKVIGLLLIICCCVDRRNGCFRNESYEIYTSLK